MATPVVFAFGPDTCFAGLAGDDKPKAEFSRKALDLAKGCEDLEKVLRHTFDNELKINPSEHKVLFAAPPVAGKCCREKISKTLFETFKVPAMFIAMDSVLASYGAGQMDALVIEANEKGTFMVTVLAGYAVPESIQKGLDLSDIAATADKVVAAIEKCDADARPKLSAHIILTGIHTLSDDLPTNLEKAIQAKLPEATVTAPPTRKYLPWIGGSVLAKLDDFKPLWITQEQFADKGTNIIHEKCGAAFGN